MTTIEYKVGNTPVEGLTTERHAHETIENVKDTAAYVDHLGKTLGFKTKLQVHNPNELNPEEKLLIFIADLDDPKFKRYTMLEGTGKFIHEPMTDDSMKSLMNDNKIYLANDKVYENFGMAFDKYQIAKQLCNDLSASLAKNNPTKKTSLKI